MVTESLISNGVSSCFPSRPRSLPMDRMDVLRLLLRHSQDLSEDKRKGVRRLKWRLHEGSWEEWACCGRERLWPRPKLHKWVLNFYDKDQQLSSSSVHLRSLEEYPVLQCKLRRQQVHSWDEDLHPDQPKPTRQHHLRKPTDSQNRRLKVPAKQHRLHR